MDTSIRLKLGKRIKFLRKEYGYTQAWLAEVVGLDYKYLQRIESKHPPALRIDTIAKLAKAFKITPSKLLDF